MNPELTTTVLWASPDAWRSQLTQRQWRWLNDDASLTERLERYAQQVKVEVLAERWQADPRSWQREVILWGDGQPWVYASSLIPESTLAHTGFDQLGEQPMGRVLFGQSRFVRGEFEFACFTVEQLPLHLQRMLRERYTGDETIWGRRSQFILQQHPLQITELFLPAAPLYQDQASQNLTSQTNQRGAV